MQIIIWILIILVAIFIIRFLRKRIKRLIFILILLILAFFIYGIFSPSGASRLWYNVRTFPQRIMSWMSDQTFLDYDGYRLDISTIKSRDDSELVDIVEKDDNVKVDDEDNKQNNEYLKNDNGPKKDSNDGKKSKNVIGYSVNDIVDIISKYIKDNLADDTDILVTIEYDDKGSVEKIVLKTHVTDNHGEHFVSLPRLSVQGFEDGIKVSKTSVATFIIGDDYILINENEKKGNNEESSSNGIIGANNMRMNNGLTQTEIREAEEIFSILL